MMPSCDQTGVPIHSSTTSGSACLMSLRILPSVFPRQSPSSAILFEISSDADRLSLAPDFFMFPSWKLRIHPHVLWQLRKRGLVSGNDRARNHHRYISCGSHDGILDAADVVPCAAVSGREAQCGRASHEFVVRVGGRAWRRTDVDGDAGDERAPQRKDSARADGGRGT